MTLAHAEPPKPAKPTKPTIKIWYGWEMLPVDLAASGVILAGVATRNDRLAWAGGAVWAINGPTVHVLNGRVDRAGLSVGLRVVTPLLLGGIVLQLGGCSDSYHSGGCRTALLGGLLGGAAAAMIIDHYQALDTVPVVPTVGFGSGGMTYGIAGRF
jgi:hypothetical protein